MDQIKQILAQMSLNLELNIAMCDMIDDHDKRIKDLENHYKAQRIKLDSLDTRVSEMGYAAASKAYEARRASMKVDK